MIRFIQRIIDIQSLDADDARRRKLLNIMLAGVGGLTLLTLLIVGSTVLLGIEEATDDVILLLGGTVTVVVGTVILYLINRFWSGSIASVLFLLLLVSALAFSDTPSEVAEGRTLFFFTIPIIMASVLLQPWSAFVAAVVVSVVTTLVGQQAGLTANIASMAGFLAIALVSWIASRSLERALDDLRKINEDLDKLVSERTRALSLALRQVSAEHGKNQAVLESIADGVLVFDEAGKVFALNPSIVSLLNRHADTVIGKTLEDLLDGKVPEEDRKKLLAQVAGEERSTSNLRVGWGQKVLSVTFATVRDQSKEMLGRVMVFRDFTSEAELERMKSAFLSMASHELRTPLNAIYGYADMLKEGVYGIVSGEQSTILQRIGSNVTRMLSLVNNLLDQAAIEAGGLKPNIGEVALRTVISDVEMTMKVLADQKGLALKVSVADDVPSALMTDPQRLQQIMINLLSNAIKFTDVGAISLNVRLDGANEWVVEVSDTGPGIPPEAQVYVFEPFRQVDDPIRRRHGGSGLGLSIVKELTRLLGGSISLSSAVGSGTTFKAVFPLVPVRERV